MKRWYEVCPAEELKPGEGTSISVGLHPYAVFNVDGVLHGVDGMCRHQQANLAAGFLNGNIIECAMHSWEYDVITWECLTIPGEDLPVFPVKVEDGMICIEIELPDGESDGDSAQ
jgi:nitrite reductase/ring-hydroxylating ferredoxin subunit